MLKKGKHFFNVIEHERNFLATLKYLTFVGSKVHAKEVLVSTMTALRHDDERIYVETTVRDYKFRCKSPADKAEWLYSFLCALYLQGNVSSYVSGGNIWGVLHPRCVDVCHVGCSRLPCSDRDGVQSCSAHRNAS